MKQLDVTLKISLKFDPRKREDAQGALAATFAKMADGIANGQTSGPLLHGGTWSINGAEAANLDRLSRTIKGA